MHHYPESDGRAGSLSRLRPAVVGHLRRILRRWDLEVRHLSYGLTYDGRLMTLLRTQACDCVLDVGANIGQFAQGLRKLGYTGDIISFEPLSPAYQVLKQKAGNEPSWQVHQLALGSADETRALNVMRASDLTSFYEPNKYGLDTFREEVVDHHEFVHVVRLDSVRSVLERIQEAKSAFLKIDTQGHDLEVFRGAKGLLPKISLLQMELSVNPIYDGTPDWKCVVDEVQDAGFAMAGMFAVTYDKSGKVIELDGLFVPNTNRVSRKMQ